VNPQVSCIVPAYNAAYFLKQALDSALAQTHGSLQLIVVDDGSTDATADIAAQFGGNIELISQSNCGVAAARNRGLAAARGEFIAFLDADDLWSPQKLSLQLAAFNENRGLELCAAHIQNFQGDLEPVGEPVPGFSTEMLIRRSLIDRLGLFTTGHQHAATLDWMLRARESRSVEQLLPETVTFRRLHQKNMSSLGANQSLKEHLQILHASLKRRKSKHS
jgi:glycosyltransferase involved in cell wall biosynthesis